MAITNVGEVQYHGKDHFNPEDKIAEHGPGPRYLTEGTPPDEAG